MISKHRLAAPYTKVANAVPTNAGFADTALKMTMAAAAALPLVAATGAGASALYQHMTAASRKAQAFKSMLDQNPQLNTHNQATVQKYYNTLHHVNPQLAADPTIAASYVMNLLNTSDPETAAVPHRDVFSNALNASGRGGGGAAAPSGFDHLMNIGKGLGEAAKMVNGAEVQKLEAARADTKRTMDQFESRIKDHAAALRDQEVRKKERMFGMGKARERSALGKLDQAQTANQRLSDDAAYFQSILDQHGHKY